MTKSWDFAAGRVKGPKTAAGERVVHIPRLLADYLRAEREADPDTLYSVNTVSLIEAGRSAPRADVLKALATALGTSMDAIWD